MSDLTRAPWKLQTYNNGKGSLVVPLVQTEIIITFGKDGSVSGTGGCNRFSGRYSVSGQGLTFGLLASTLMACAPVVNEQEAAYLAALNATRSHAIEADQLTLRGGDGSTQATYLAVSF